MPKIKNVSGQDLVVPWLGDRLVAKGQLVDVDADQVYAFTLQDAWAAYDDDAKAAHDEGAAAEAEGIDEVEPTQPQVAAAAPAGNASRDEWAQWAVTSGAATVDDIADMGRDAIRDTYGPVQDPQLDGDVDDTPEEN